MYSVNFVVFIFSYISSLISAKKLVYAQSYLSPVVYNMTTRWEHNVIYDQS